MGIWAQKWLSAALWYTLGFAAWTRVGLCGQVNEEGLMAKEASVAPKERVNITYKPATGDAQEEVELPLKVLVIGDYTGRPDDTPLEDRKPINIDKDNFTEVLSEQKLGMTSAVPDKLSRRGRRRAGGEPRSSRRSRTSSPRASCAQVPELQKLLELRAALTALKGPLGNAPRLPQEDRERSSATKVAARS